MRLHFAHVVCLGGGMVGQLLQLSVPSVRLLDSRRQAPKDHLDTRVGPQYLWEPIPDCPSERFWVRTLVDSCPPTRASILAYKKKIGKEQDGGDWGLQFQPKMVGWRSELPVPRVEYNRQVTKILVTERSLLFRDGSRIDYDLLLSTIPLPAFIALCDVPPLVHTPFRSDPIHMLSEKDNVPVRGMIFNYISRPEVPFYRETYVEDRIYYESLTEITATKFKHSDPVILNPGKIHPHAESERIVKGLQHFGIHCFGRYGTWRPDELAHQTWQQIAAWRMEVDT